MRNEDRLSCLALWTVAEARRRRQVQIGIESAMADHPAGSGPPHEPLSGAGPDAPIRPSPGKPQPFASQAALRVVSGSPLGARCIENARGTASSLGRTSSPPSPAMTRRRARARLSADM
jgi:hypothetical protein